jgi:hypothetical protein
LIFHGLLTNSVGKASVRPSGDGLSLGAMLGCRRSGGRLYQGTTTAGGVGPAGMSRKLVRRAPKSLTRLIAPLCRLPVGGLESRFRLKLALAREPRMSALGRGLPLDVSGKASQWVRKLSGGAHESAGRCRPQADIDASNAGVGAQRLRPKRSWPASEGRSQWHCPAGAEIVSARACTAGLLTVIDEAIRSLWTGWSASATGRLATGSSARHVTALRYPTETLSIFF